MKRVVCIYHSVDLDGHCSALIVNSFYSRYCDEFESIGWNYGNPLVELGDYDMLIMVDISFPPEVMMSLPKNKVIWIDHHRTAIENSIKFGYDDLKGIRQEGVGACELCWLRFFGDTPLPKFIRLLSMYDVWNKKGEYDWDTEILPLQYGIKHKYQMRQETLLPVFGKLIDEGSKEFKEVCTCGNDILEYQRKRWKSQVKNYSFPVLVAGIYKGIAMLTPDGGSMMFESVLDQYDIYIVINRKTREENGTQRYTISMYSEPGRIDFSLGNYVQSFGLGGGGHPCACGSDISEEQFLKLILNHEI